MTEKLFTGMLNHNQNKTKINPSPQCYIPSFVEIGPLVPEKIFEGFMPYGHVTTIMLLNLHFNVPKSLHTKFG